jgi:hypothetical protein
MFEQESNKKSVTNGKEDWISTALDQYRQLFDLRFKR